MRDHVRRDAELENDQPQAAAVEEPEHKTKFVGGAIPPVQVGDDQDPEELKSKVSALIERNFGGHYQDAFEHYDRDNDGRVTKEEIMSLLFDAGVGSGRSRGMWVDRILDKLDMNHDRGVQWQEFETVFCGHA